MVSLTLGSASKTYSAFNHCQAYIDLKTDSKANVGVSLFPDGVAIKRLMLRYQRKANLSPLKVNRPSASAASGTNPNPMKNGLMSTAHAMDAGSHWERVSTIFRTGFTSSGVVAFKRHCADYHKIFLRP